MNIRTFGWRDLSLLRSYRKQGLFLDSARALIHGTALVPLGSYLPFSGRTTRIFTYRGDNSLPSGKPIIGQATYANGSTYARLAFLAPENGIEAADLAAMSDYMAFQLGEKGVFHILAEIDESSPVFSLIHNSGFAIYARQRIWKLEGQAAGETDAVPWSAGQSGDIIAARSLYCNVVPGLVQQVEPLQKKKLNGFVYYLNGDLKAYVDVKFGRYGIWVQAFVHPDVEGFGRQLVHLLRTLPDRHERALYICVRSYQSWLEAAVEEMGALPGPRQAVMVRHLTLAQRVKQTYALKAMNGSHAEPTAPVAQIGETRVLEISDTDHQPRIDSI